MCTMITFLLHIDLHEVPGGVTRAFPFTLDGCGCLGAQALLDACRSAF
jgi:hypothetical protein